MKKDFVSKENYDIKLTIKVSGDGNGIQIYKEDLTQGSELKLPRHAPEDGYTDSLTFAWSRHIEGHYAVTNHTGFAEQDNYIFRTRAVFESGKVVNAMCGKILNPFKVGSKGGKTVKLLFRYWLNPDYTQNLEYDPRRNLFKGKIKSFEDPGLN
ncbi:MAG: hypothetical protein C0609_03305 [Deltaproteobacteria bacterium]|nr:MAG: hypothetical protein C0609_03305 [Deltaproteobacteria bacterium]